MANYPQKSNVPVGVDSRSHDPLSHITIASQDFGLVMPISCNYMVPGDEFHINVNEVTRLLPLVNPAYIKADSIVRGFAVPISYFYSNFNDFISGDVSGTANMQLGFRPSSVPYSYAYEFRDAFVQNGLLVKVTDITTQPIDFRFGTSGDKEYMLTWKGRRMFKILQGLGINLDFNDPDGGDMAVAGYQDVYHFEVALTPLLAFCKFYLDWIVPSRFIDQYSRVKYLVTRHWQNNNELHVPSTVLKDLLIDFGSFLDNDYFTAAWKYPGVQDNDSSLGTFSVPSYRVFDSEDTPNVAVQSPYGAVSNQQADSNFLSSLSLQSVGALQKMLNKGMITGNKIKDWLKSEFGIEPSKDALKTSSYLGYSRNTVQIGEVFSSADTSASGGQALGSYAGRGNLHSGSLQCSYKADQHSVLILTAEIIPHSVYYQGMRPLANMLNRFDFFQPEFDNVGVRAIARKELFSGCDMEASNFDPDTSGARYLDGIFGFAPQYSHLKTGYDNVIGDFRLPRFANSLNSWFAARKFENPQNSGYYDNINKNFCMVDGIENALGYDDIFTYQGTDVDHFYSLFDIDIQTNRPMAPLSDALILEEDRGKRTVGVNTNNNPNV